MDLAFSIDSSKILVDVTTIVANNSSNGFLRSSGLSPTYYLSAAAVIAAKKKWEKYRFLCRNTSQQVVPFAIEVRDRRGHFARQLFKRLFSKIMTAANRVSHKFWLTAYVKCTVANIVHSFHTMKRYIFGPLAPQELYFFEPYYVQPVDSSVDIVP